MLLIFSSRTVNRNNSKLGGINFHYYVCTLIGDLQIGDLYPQLLPYLGVTNFLKHENKIFFSIVAIRCDKLFTRQLKKEYK